MAREQARKDLPLSTYTEAYWKIDLHNLLHFLAVADGRPRPAGDPRITPQTIGQQIVRAAVSAGLGSVFGLSPSRDGAEPPGRRRDCSAFRAGKPDAKRLPSKNRHFLAPRTNRGKISSAAARRDECFDKLQRLGMVGRSD